MVLKIKFKIKKKDLQG